MNGIERVFLGDWHMTAYACLKALILFIVVAAAFRVTQRRTLAEFTPFDWLTAVAVGSIVGRTAVASDASLVAGIAAVLTLMIAHWALARLRFVPRLRRLVDPPLQVLIRDGEVDQRNLRRCGLTRADLDAVLRQHGHRGPEGIRLAIFEEKGSISVLTEGPASL